MEGGGDIRLDLQSKDIITSEINVPVWLEKYTGRKKAVFCYKDGYIPRNQIKLIKDNFSCAVSIWQGNTYDPYMRNRVVVKATHDFSDDGVFFKTSDTNNLISVIVPVYNAERYLHDFFVSILNQTYKNLEIILVDDKSTDNSLEIIKHYSKIDNRLKIIENSKNLGVGRTIYNGMEKATGYFCSIMSPDDVIDLRYYEELINRYKETGSDVICGRLLISKNHYAYSDFQDITLITCESKLSAVFYFYPSLITRKLIVQFDIYNKSTTERHWEDIICRSKYAYYANHVSIANKAIRYYIIHDTSLSHKSKEVQLPYMEMAEEKNRHFFTSVGYPDLYIEIVDGFRIVGGWDLKLWYSKKESEKVEIKERKITKFIRLARDLLKLS